MSHFSFGAITKDENKLGVWLRPESNEQLLKKIKKVGRVKPHETVHRIIIEEVNNMPHKQLVYIQVWLYKITIGQIFRILFKSKPKAIRFIVFGFWENENPEWICEGDLGTGLKK